MDTPQPVDVSRLKAILGNAKKVMQHADNVKPITLSENTQKQIEVDTNEEPMTEQASREYSDEQVMKSRLPEAVKKAMIDRRVPHLTAPPPKFTLDDLDDNDEKPMIPNKRATITKAPIRENLTNKNSDLITISKTELNEMIKDQLVDFLTQSYNKTLTEEAIKKTINMLIKEGKLTVKKKTI